MRSWSASSRPAARCGFPPRSDGAVPAALCATIGGGGARDGGEGTEHGARARWWYRGAGPLDDAAPSMGSGDELRGPRRRGNGRLGGSDGLGGLGGSGVRLQRGGGGPASLLRANDGALIKNT